MNNKSIIDIGMQKRAGILHETWDELNESLGKPYKDGEAFRQSMKDKALKNGKATARSVPAQTELVEINKDGSRSSSKLVSMSEEDSKSVTFLLNAHGFGDGTWDLVSAKSKKWDAQSKGAVRTLYSSHITVRPKNVPELTLELASKIYDELVERGAKSEEREAFDKNYSDEILVIPIADLHYGLNAELVTTGNIYNRIEAEKIYYRTLNDILDRTENKTFRKIVFVVGNDFLNFDNIQGTTTRGTPQDNDGSWFAVYEGAINILVGGIELLKSKKCKIDVMFVPSNHDLHSMFGIMQTIGAYYKDDPNVSIDRSPLPRKYYRFGKTLIGLSHNIKTKDALKIISTEAKIEWSECDSIVLLLAHLHTGMIYEKQGYLETYRLPTISGWSRWSNDSGYVQTDKRNKSFIVNADLGITDEINTIIK